MDGFSFESPKRRGPQIDRRTLTFAAGALLLVAVLLVAYLQLTSGGASPAAVSSPTASAADTAGDVQAKAAAKAAASAASAAFQASNGYATIGPEQLSLLDPDVTFTTDPSTSASVVSVASAQAAWAAAVLGPSGTCYWIKIGGIGAVSYGTGTTCTGAAAMTASQPRW
jgi:hypothetical protein